MKSTILGLLAETSIHAGTGQNTGVVDLPIQREAHTGWPCIFGSAMKGAVRAHAELRGNWADATLWKVFGADNASSASAVSVTDARLLLLPIRSLTGHFRLATCPAVLDRLKRDLALIGCSIDITVPGTESGKVTSPNGGQKLFLEEFEYEQKTEDMTVLLTALAGFGIEKEALEKQLVIMCDDDFADYCATATAITPHIAIDNTTKTVKNGALWYEESLPPSTLLYTLLMGKDAELGEVVAMLDQKYLQVGGNETLGMGWCKVSEVKP